MQQLTDLGSPIVNVPNYRPYLSLKIGVSNHINQPKLKLPRHVKRFVAQDDEVDGAGLIYVKNAVTTSTIPPGLNLPQEIVDTYKSPKPRTLELALRLYALGNHDDLLNLDQAIV